MSPRVVAARAARARTAVGRAGSLRRDVVFNAGGGAVTMVSQLVSIPLGLLVAGTAAYGGWAALLAAAQYAALFDLGLAAATLRQVALRLERRAGTALAGVLGASLAATAVVALLAAAGFAAVAALIAPGLSAAWRLPGGGVALVVAASACAVLLAALGRHFQAVNQGAHRYDVERLHQLVAVALRILVLGVALTARWGIAGVVAAELLALALPGALSAARIRRTAPGARWGAPRRLPVVALLRYGVPWFGAATATQAAALLPTAVIGVSGGAVAAAAMAAAARLAQAVRQVVAWVLDPVVPAAAAADRAGARRMTGAVTRAVVSIAVWLVVPAACLAGPAMTVWLGPGPVARDGALFFAALGLAFLATVPHLAFGTVVLARGRPAFYAPETVVGAALTLTGVAAAAATGPDAVGAAILGAALLVEVSCLLRLRRATEPAELQRILGAVRDGVRVAVPAAAVAVGALVLLGGSAAILQLAVGGAAYLAVAAVVTGVARGLRVAAQPASTRS